jgi:taurine transport system permease protein
MNSLTNNKKLLISFGTIIFIILIWTLVTNLKLVPPLYLPAPKAVLLKFIDVAQRGYMDATLWEHLLASLLRVFYALILAVVVGIPLGILIGINKFFHAVIDPLIEFYRPVPPLAYLPLIVIWFGIGEFSKVLLIALAIFAPVVVTTSNGVRSVSQVTIRGAQTLGANSYQLVRYVILPSALPSILTGIRIGLGIGWSTLVAAELIAATKGLGFMIQSASQFLITDLVIAGILIIATIAYAMEIGLRHIQKILVPWVGKSF